MKKPIFRLFDFEVLNERDNEDYMYNGKKFLIKMFGMDKKGKTYCIFVKNFNPFFYIKAPDDWTKGKEDVNFKVWLKNQPVGTNPEPTFGDAIISCKMVKRQDLYGFDNGKEYNFLKIEFDNTTTLNKVKKLWYTDVKNFRKRKLLKKGYKYDGTGDYLQIYEAVLPPLLRYFHIMDISPSGWASFKKTVQKRKGEEKETDCDYEYITTYKNIKSLTEKEDAVPMKIMSFDIEASSSHGDFPVARKTYKKMLGEIIQYWTQHKKVIKKLDANEKKMLLIELIYTAFGKGNKYGISNVFVKKKSMVSIDQIKWKIEESLKKNNR